MNVKQFDWEAAQKEFPLACHDDFVERWAQAVVRESIKARAALAGRLFKSWTDESSPTSRQLRVLVLLPLLFRFSLILMRRVCCELCRSFTLAM